MLTALFYLSYIRNGNDLHLCLRLIQFSLLLYRTCLLKAARCGKINYLRWNLIINPDSFLYVVIELSDLRQVVISDKTD